VILVVTSDHGGTGRGHAAGEERDVHIPWIAWGSGVVPGPFEDPVTTYDTAATLLWLFGVEVPAAWDGAAVRAPFGQEGATSGSGARAYRCG
jgi:arylsulfatase A-like enzyme